MIIINDELLANVFGKERVPFCKDLLMHSLTELIKREEYGKEITKITIYELQSDPQKYVDNWMRSSIAKTEVAEYYKELSFKGEINMNKYETLLKKYGKLSREFEAYREVTEDIADKGTYITNEALEELQECKKKYDTLFKEHKAYCCSAEDVAVKLIETEKKYDELQEENVYFKEMIEKRQEKCRKLTSENDTLLKECKILKEERDDLVKEVYYLHEVINEKNNKCKEKMEKIKQRDKQITELVSENNSIHALYMETKKENDALAKRLETEKKYDELKKENDALKTLYAETAKERDDFEKRLEHINTMSNLETETTRTPWDELVDFCENRGICSDCPKRIFCDGINSGLRPRKWNEDEIAEYNELIDMKEEK